MARIDIQTLVDRAMMLPPDARAQALRAITTLAPKRTDVGIGMLKFCVDMGRGFEVNWHHKNITDYFERWAFGDIKKLMVMIPRRHGKSEIVSRRGPAWILGRNPDAKIIAVSHTNDLAVKLNRNVQSIIDSQKYAAIFPRTRLYGKGVSSETNKTYVRNTSNFEIVGAEGSYASSGIGGRGAGIGFTHGIIDDPHKNAQDAFSLLARDKIWEWYWSTFYGSREPDARILLTLTRWHEDDLAGRLLATENDWIVVRYLAIHEDRDTCADDPRSEGEALWPKKQSEEDFANIRRVQPYWYEAMYQQRPRVPEGTTFKKQWMRYRTEAMPTRFDKIVQSWDCAFKGTNDSDFVVGQVWGKLGAVYHLLDQVRGRWSFPETVKAIRALTEKWPTCAEKLIEDKANGPAVIDTLKKEVSGMIAVNPQGGKQARAEAVAFLVEAGNVILPPREGNPWVDDLVEELCAFPKGPNDDQVDALTQALIRLQRRPSGQLLSVYSGSRDSEMTSWMGGQ